MLKRNKVILFPKWQKQLENESLVAIKEHRYKDALHKINELLAYDVPSNEIMMRKLVCLMELERFDEAEDVCEDLLKEDNEHYFEYVHIYLSILYQTEQYALLIEQVEHELEKQTLPFSLKEQFQLLHRMSMEMLEEITEKKAANLLSQLKTAIDKQQYARQWQIIESLHKMKIKPTTEIYALFTDKEVHPVVKTATFNWLQNEGIDQEINISKMNNEIFIVPSEVSTIRDHSLMKKVLVFINDVEVHNPSLFILLNQMLYRYLYVLYPLLPTEDEALPISKALKEIGNELLHLDKKDESDPHVLNYIEELKMCETLYLSVIEE